MTQGGPIIPVTVSTDAPTGEPALRVVGSAAFTMPPGTEGGPARPVVLISDAQVAAGYPVQGNVPVPMALALDGRPVVGQHPIPVYVVSGSLKTYQQRLDALYPSDQILNLPLSELAGPTAVDRSAQANNGTYATSGVTYGEPGIGDGLTAVAFSGADTHVKIGSAAFGADWNGNKGSAVAWGKIDSAARWADGLVGWWFHVRASDDTNYNVVFGKSASNTIQWRRRSGAANPVTSVSKVVSAPTGWLFMGMTWDFSVPEIRAYDASGLVGTATTGMTDWPPGTHVPDSINLTLLFAGTTTLQEWFGWGAHTVCWANRVLTAAEIASIAAP